MIKCDFCDQPAVGNHVAIHRQPVPCSTCGTRIKNIRAHYRRYHGVPFENESHPSVVADQAAAHETYGVL